MKSTVLVFMSVMCLLDASCQNDPGKNIPQAMKNGLDTVMTTVGPIYLPKPYATRSVRNNSTVIGWQENRKPVAPVGFNVTKFAGGLDNPRWVYIAPNGDIFVAESGGKNKNNGRILLFREKDNDGIPDLRSEFLKNLNQPFGMLILGDHFYVANTDEVLMFPYSTGMTAMKGEGTKIVSLPAGGRHWTRNIISNSTGDKLFITVGSGSNVAENGIDKENRRACILQVNLDGSGERTYASGLRNPVGMAWAPGTDVLWTAVNERDELGDDLVPDYLTSVKDKGFYGWPYSYFGQLPDPRINNSEQRPDLISRAIIPDVSLGPHTASLGLAFYTGNSFPSKYHNGAFIGQHGSWNRSSLSGYKVVFVPFSNGKPSGLPEDFLTGFIADESKNEVYGRPVSVAVTTKGALLLADDAGNSIWYISAK